MSYSIAYIAYSDDKVLKERSFVILNRFFADEDYSFQKEFTGILFVASGGSEQYAVELCKSERNIILLCHRENNSYAASLEIAAYMRANAKRVSIIDVFADGAWQAFVEVYQVNKAISALENQKAALIGEVSDWLIVSDIEKEKIKEKLGIDLMHLPWATLPDYKKKNPSESFAKHFPKHNKLSLTETSKVYSLLSEVIDNHKLSAISVECFSLVKRDQVTACLPLAVLNNENSVAACEGDICSMVGKMIIRSLIGTIPWQANVAEIKEDTILFAHCTAPLNLLSSFNITTHFETGVGTAIQGTFEKEKVAAFRINNTLDKYMLLEGEIIETPQHNFACRTQIEFKTSAKQALLLKNASLGNHHLIFSAGYIPLINRMMEQLQIKRVG